MFVKPLVHNKPETKKDEELAKEAKSYFDQHPALQAQAEIWYRTLELIKTPNEQNKLDILPWWNLQYNRDTFTVTERMRCLAQRPDIRQQITTKLTGMKQKAARAMDANLQASLIDSAVDQNDITLLELEEAFDAQTWAVYLFKNTFWNALAKDALGKAVEANTAREKEFFAFMLDVFLKSRGTHDGKPLKPILSHLDVRQAIDLETWIKRIPIEKRIAVDRARLDQERKNPKGQSMTALQEIEIVGLETIVGKIDLVDLVPVINKAGEAMGFVEITLDMTEGENAEPPKG